MEIQGALSLIPIEKSGGPKPLSGLFALRSFPAFFSVLDKFSPQG
jgi:hypothetical protein